MTSAAARKLALGDKLVIFPSTALGGIWAPGSAHADRFWLPLIGPSCMAFLRLVGFELAQSPDGCELDVARTGRRLGIPGHDMLAKTISRCVYRNLAKEVPWGFEVRCTLPPLTDRQLLGLDIEDRTAHALTIAARLTRLLPVP